MASTTQLMQLLPAAIIADSPYVDWHFWSRVSSTDWWNHIIMQAWDAQQWHQNLHMKKQTFLDLSEQLAHAKKQKKSATLDIHWHSYSLPGNGTG